MTPPRDVIYNVKQSDYWFYISVSFKIIDWVEYGVHYHVVETTAATWLSCLDFVHVGVWLGVWQPGERRGDPRAERRT